jgi:hypothetical protein
MAIVTSVAVGVAGQAVPDGPSNTTVFSLAQSDPQGACIVVADGMCVAGGPYLAAGNRTCSFNVEAAATLRLHPDSTATATPTVTLDGVVVDAWADNVTVVEGQVLVWTFDQSVRGVYICADNAVPPASLCLTRYVAPALGPVLLRAPFAGSLLTPLGSSRRWWTGQIACLHASNRGHC